MEKSSYEKIYDWDNVLDIFESFLPELIKMQKSISKENIIEDLPNTTSSKLKSIGFSKEGRDPYEVTRQLIDAVYPYRMKMNHPRYFCFIPNHMSPYSVFGEFLNSIHNPYGGSFNISKGTAILENETIRWMGALIGFDTEKSGGLFVSGGSIANLTALIAGRDEKLAPKDLLIGTLYISDQTHSSVAKAAHLMGLPKNNVRIIPTDTYFKIDTAKLKYTIEQDIANGLKPFLLVANCGTTNTGSIDPLDELGKIAEKYNLWYHIDGAYGASILLSSHKALLKGIDTADSVSWDGHKWLFQTYGCGAVICKDKMKLVNTFHTNPEYLKDVESTDDAFNHWDMGIELTKPARGMKLWFTLQTVGTSAMRDAIDKGFVIANWIEEEISKYDNFEIVSHSQMGIINFRFVDSTFTEKELDIINRNLSKRALENNYATFLTTTLRGKVVLRFCTNNPLTTQNEIKRIIKNIQQWIYEEITISAKNAI